VGAAGLGLTAGGVVAGVVGVPAGADGVVTGVLGVVWPVGAVVVVGCELALVAAVATSVSAAPGAVSAASEHVNMNNLVIVTEEKGSQSRGRYRRLIRDLQTQEVEVSADRLVARSRSLFVSVAHRDALTGEVEDCAAHAPPVLTAILGEVGFLP